MKQYSKSRFMAVATLALVGLAAYAGAMAEDKNTTATAKPAASPHSIGASKLIVDDLKKAQDFYEKVFGVKEVAHYSSANVFDESILGFGDGARLALFEPKAEPAFKKSQYPVVAIYTSEIDAVKTRIKEIGLGFRELKPSSPTAKPTIIAQDPSGNAVEIISR